MSDRVSIIIPVYNTEKYVAEAVESALNQTYENCEVIAVDGGSTDGTVKVLEKFSSRVTVIRMKYCYTAGTLNEGIRRMSGEWFKWLSADDRLYPWTVADLMKAAAKADDRHDCIFVGDREIMDASGTVTGAHHEPDTAGWSRHRQNSQMLFGGGIGDPCTSLIHKSAFERYGDFNGSYVVYEDYEMWLRLCVLHGFRVVTIPKPLAQRRMHDTQLSALWDQDRAHQMHRRIRDDVIRQLPPSQRDLYAGIMRRCGPTPEYRILWRPWRFVKRTLPIPRSLTTWVTEFQHRRMKRHLPK